MKNTRVDSVPEIGTPLSWAEQELCDADLGDRRLNRRLIRLVSDLAARPTATVPHACGDWAATQGAYRFWDNDRIEPRDILGAHTRRTRDRLPTDARPILAIQDTTVLNYSAHPGTTGLGYLSDLEQRGLLVHSVLAVDADGVPLGLLDQQFRVRPDDQFGTRNTRRRKRTADKETRRWIDGVRATEAALPADQPVLTVADREADFYDLFATPRRPGHDLLIRAKGPRRIRHEARLLSAGIARRPRLGRLRVKLPRANDRPGRTAVLVLRAGAFAIEPPLTHPDRQNLPTIGLSVVLAEEPNPPRGVPPVRWLLMSTQPVRGFDGAARVVGLYARRWLIERYNFVLKSGCRVERLELETEARLERALATYAVVAWRVLWLTYLARRDPEAPSDAVLDRSQWQVLQLHHGQIPTAAPPTLREAVRLIARLGGFLDRTHDGPPGVKVLWRGLARLGDLVNGYRLARQQPPPNVVGNA